MIISISSGFLVTKISSSRSVGQDLSKQLFKSSQPLTIASFVIAAIGFVPGLPMLPFLLLASGAGIMSRMVAKNEKGKDKKSELTAGSQSQKGKDSKQQPIEEMLDIDRVSVQVGVRLISLVDPRKDSAIFDRIGALRRKFAQQLGIVMPLVRLRDNINIDSNAYEIRLCDHTVATGRLEPNMFLAMDSGATKTKIEGIPTAEPVYGLPALWITEATKEKAEMLGYTVIDPESVFITHLSETLRKHADELLTREDVQQLVDRLRKTQPSLVGEVVGEVVPVGTLQRVLKNLLKNGIPIRELQTVLEALGEYAGKTKNPELLTEVVRKHLSRTITDQYKDKNGKVPAISLDPALEHQMASNLRQEGEQLTIALPSETTMAITNSIANAWKSVMDKGVEKVVMLCDSRLRMPLSGMLGRQLPQLPVIAYNEIVLGTDIEPLETIGIPQGPKTINQKQELAGATA
jgi:flagellar biosynthesis protein FlhA